MRSFPTFSTFSDSEVLFSDLEMVFSDLEVVFSDLEVVFSDLEVVFSDSEVHTNLSVNVFFNSLTQYISINELVHFCYLLLKLSCALVF